jgi:hypothetical protein
MPNSGSIYGSFNGSSANNFIFRIDWTVLQQDNANRKSKVKFSWNVQRKYSGQNTYKYPAPWSQTTDGSTDSGSINFDIRNTPTYTDLEILTNTVWIQHGVNGKKTAAVSGTLNLSGTSAGTGSFSGSIVLPDIPVTPPSINSFAISDVGTSLASGVYVEGKSVIKLTATATAYEGATVSSYAFYRDGTLIGNNTTGVLTEAGTAISGSHIYKVIVTDSYGMTAEQSLAAITVYPYSLPKIDSSETYRCDTGGTEQSGGPSVKVKASWTTSSCGGYNTSSGTAAVNGYSASLTNGTAARIDANLNPAAAYTVTYTITDSFGETAVTTVPVLSAFRNFALYPDGTVGGFAFGEMPTSPGVGVFNTPHVIFRGDVKVEDALLPSDTQNVGTLAAAESALLNVFANMPDRSVTFAMLTFTASFSPFGGYATLFQICRTNSSYGVVTGYSYDASSAKLFKAAVLGGALTSWVTI